ncbi:MAG: TolC family protein [Candidatus Obscuribacterales bacterium]|nr:TolC family protein [Candidatus Obscuribacterales bacterium]
MKVFWNVNRLWPCLGFLFLFCASASTPVSALLDPLAENKKALSDSEKQLRTSVPDADAKKAPRYIIELKATQTVKAFGKEAVQNVELPLERIDADGINLQNGEDDTGVLIERPSLVLLIKIQNNLSPFSFDARYITKVTLRETLETALNQNLEIDNAYSRMRSQKYQFLSTASGFLPSLNSGYSLFGITGSIPGALFGAGGSAGGASLPGTVQLLNAGFSQNLYQGGKVLFGTKQESHKLKAQRADLKSNVNDTLLSAARRHYELLLNEALLAIRTRAVSISQEQVRLNTLHEKAGIATGLDVLQSQAQLASDEQNLVEQQNARRQSAIQLAHVLNSSFAQDIESTEKYLRKRRLVSTAMPIDELLKMAVDKRPELKQYEELRLAAKQAIIVAASPLQPKITLAGSVYGIGAGSSNLDPLYTLNFGVKWALGGLGTSDLANIQKAKWDARQAAIQAKQIFLNVFEEVRSSYDTSLAAEKRIDRASVQIRAAEEELRIAKKRMDAGVGLNIDVLNAQRDLTQASINKARAILDFNVAQAQLLRDIGAISVEGLVRGINSTK